MHPFSQLHKALRSGLVMFMVLGATALLGACSETHAAASPDNPSAAQSVPEVIPMGGAKSVTTFFITSVGVGRGADLGGLAGADAHCQALAEAEYAGDHTWRAYLSTMATETAVAVHARDRIGSGPWYNAEGMLIAADVKRLHGDGNRMTKATATTQRLDPVNGVGDSPNQHDILTGSRPDGTAFDDAQDLTCGNWLSNNEGRAQVGHHDRRGRGDSGDSWNSAHASRGCSQEALVSTGGAGLFYCFGID